DVRRERCVFVIVLLSGAAVYDQNQMFRLRGKGAAAREEGGRAQSRLLEKRASIHLVLQLDAEQNLSRIAEKVGSVGAERRARHGRDRILKIVMVKEVDK